MSVYEVIEKEDGGKRVLDIFSKKPVLPFEKEIVLALLAAKEGGDRK